MGWWAPEARFGLTGTPPGPPCVTWLYFKRKWSTMGIKESKCITEDDVPLAACQKLDGDQPAGPSWGKEPGSDLQQSYCSPRNTGDWKGTWPRSGSVSYLPSARSALV